MKWTRDIPDRPGWYLKRQCYNGRLVDERPYLFEVVEVNGKLCIGGYGQWASVDQYAETLWCRVTKPQRRMIP